MFYSMSYFFNYHEEQELYHLIIWQGLRIAFLLF
jgi:hypothetical protein